MTPAQDPEALARRRLIEACEEVRAAAKALGLEPDRIGGLYAPLAMRVDHFLARTKREAAGWALLSSALPGRSRDELEWIDNSDIIEEWAALAEVAA